MKINLTEKIRRAIRSASMTSKILFILCCISGLLWVFGSGRFFLSINFWFLLTGFLGVLWLSSIALHSFRKSGAGKRNPFTSLIVLCIAVMILCGSISSLWQPVYHSDSEPIELVSARFQTYLDKYGEQLAADQSGRLMEFSMNVSGTDTNVILTDENGNVLYSENQWLTGNHEILRALICPATYESGTGFMILVDGKGSVVSAFQMDSGYFSGSSSAGYSSLTIPAQTDEETAMSSGDPLFDRYFPSFGTAIDSMAIRLAGDNSLVVEDADMNETYVSVSDWNGENISHFSDYIANLQRTTELIRALNNLTVAQRDEFKAYIAWLKNALDAAQRGDGDGAPYRARILTSSDGSTNLYMLYKYDTDALFPLQDKYYKEQGLREMLKYIALLMIPAIIVFLAFWVFIDAKKRGQSSPALWAILTLIGNIVAWIIYMLVRPQMTVGVTGEKMPKGTCPICGTKLKSDFIACPGCGILLRSRCKNCGKALENDWSFCPYCTTAVTKEIPSSQEEKAE